jgi:hypothetical protein
VVDVKKMGAKGNGMNDDTKFIQAAIDKAFASKIRTIYFPPGVYLIKSWDTTYNYLENYSILLKSRVCFSGEGAKSVIKLGNNNYDKSEFHANAHIFYGNNLFDISFDNLTFDLNGRNNLTPEKSIKNFSALFLNNCRLLTINRVVFKNATSRNMIILKGNGNNVAIINCSFVDGGNNAGESVFNPHQTDFSFVYCEWDSLKFMRNRVIQNNLGLALAGPTGGLEVHGSNSKIEDNYFVGCNPAIFITSSKGRLANILIQNNSMSKCLRGISFWLGSDLDSVRITNNTILLTYSRSLKLPFITGIELPNGNANEYNFWMANNGVINKLEICGNNISSEGNPGDDLFVGIMLHSIKNCKIFKNSIHGLNYCGVLLLGSKWGINTISIRNNSINLTNLKKNHTATSGGVIVFDVYSKSKGLVLDNIRGVSIANNIFKRSKKNREDYNDKKFGTLIIGSAYLKNSISFETNSIENITHESRFVIIE